MKKLAAAIALSSIASFTCADENLTFNASVVSDYAFRGISQTDEDIALQGGADYAFDSGFYVGVWGSNVDFGHGYDATTEVDLYVGYAGQLTEEIGFDISYIDYTYLKQSSLNYEEYALALTYADFTFGYNYSDEFWGGEGMSSMSYYSLGYSLDVYEDYNLAFSAGYTDFDEDTWLNGKDSYTDWSVALSKSFAGVDFSLAYIDTNLSKKDVFGVDWAESRAVLSVGKSF